MFKTNIPNFPKNGLIKNWDSTPSSSLIVNIYGTLEYAIEIGSVWECVCGGGVRRKTTKQLQILAIFLYYKIVIICYFRLFEPHYLHAFNQSYKWFILLERKMTKVLFGETRKCYTKLLI